MQATKERALTRSLAIATLGFATACGTGEVSGKNGDTTGSPQAGGATAGSTAATSGGAMPGGGATPTGGVTSASNGGSGGTGAPAGGAGSASAGSSSSGAASSACKSDSMTPTPLRRLTKFEYTNTVKNLLNVDPSPASALPEDEVTGGFDNNAGVLTVSSLHVEKYTLVSEALAKSAVQNLSALTACDAVATGEDACALAFAKSFGRRAFRRPTTAQDEQMLMAAYSAGKTGGSYSEGIEVMIRAALQSPDFLYRLETTTPSDANAKLVPLSQFELATRLSYLIWAAGPDDSLLDAAAQGKLATREQVATLARSMLNDPKARSAIADFYTQWAGTTRLGITTKDTNLFPSFSADMRAAMAREVPALIDYVLWSGGDHKFSTLLTAPVAFVSGPLAALYGVQAPAASGTTPQMVTVPAAQGRAGILTQASVLAVQAHPDQTSPVLRGKFVRSMLLCSAPPPPPPDVNISVPAVDPNSTARERFSAHLTAGTSCNGCHQLMDPIGFAFENFDAMGQYRQTDGGKTIDASGEVVGATGTLAGPFNGARELATKLADSDQARNCLATQWFRYAAGRSEADADACSLSTLQSAFGATGGDLVELMVAITQTDSFWYRSPIVK